MAAPPRGRRRRVLLVAAAVGYALLCSRIVWVWEKDFTGVDGFLGSNAYVWISLALLAFLPIRRGWLTPAAACSAVEASGRTGGRSAAASRSGARRRPAAPGRSTAHRPADRPARS